MSGRSINMPIKKGDRIPSATLKIMSESGPAQITTAEYFAGRKVVLVSVPGAFTPTCSARHLPGFIDHANEILAKGVDTIAFVSVNDVFVMNAWGKSAGAGNIQMLADGNGEFASALGLELDATAFGMGMRSQRFALIADDGVVAELFVEEPGEFQVSSAENVLANL
jgi:peroxiredoxin